MIKSYNFINDIFNKQTDLLMTLCELLQETSYVKFGYWPSLDSMFKHQVGRGDDCFLKLPEKSFTRSQVFGATAQQIFLDNTIICLNKIQFS